MKILYIDENYIMFFACYTGQTDEPCEHQGSEISIVGRTRDLNETVREQMFALLPNTCIDSADVLETNFEGAYKLSCFKRDGYDRQTKEWLNASVVA